ncbi:MAG: hypothetical protein EOS10_14785 [Mesorhizobium sp.]|uniref:hypothetical protein n=1 Tax=Mesorhizobium sp. TaxID=1871066 RepID=UPI000FE721F7|nr:hypothetical protein [Mesorhizobium sp.]RWO31614.1 MAG: hypothetical protein EOS10_14785 [Mesorhizobium sp.]TIN76177.1 MAG: hypothetical protein E5Y09_24485 [Mesorhizobium sp.]
MPNITVRAAAEGMPAINRRRLLNLERPSIRIDRRRMLLGMGATAAALAAASTIALVHTKVDNLSSFAKDTAGELDAGAIPSTGKESLDALLLQLPPEEAHRLRIEFIAIISTVREMCARGEDRQLIRDFVRTRCQQNEMDWKREQGI